MHLEHLDHRDIDVAAAIVAVQQAAYPLEAELIGFDRIPPLIETSDDIAALDLVIIGSIDTSGEMLGLVGYQRVDDLVDIDRLAVLPQCGGRGIATTLLTEVHEREHDAPIFEVSTGAANAPAIGLYRKLGYRRTGSFEIPDGPTMLTLRRG
ncbi:MAG: GNAT family N-acetyltransferase [Actinomycetota bacterium]